jgi:hypothetical protein
VRPDVESAPDVPSDFGFLCELNETRELDTVWIEAVSFAIRKAWSNDDAADLLLRLCVPNIRFSMDAENRRDKLAT